MDDTLLITKLYIPKPRTDWIDRKKLVRFLEDGLRGGSHLTLVCAPAGYGKSALVTGWLADRAAAEPHSLTAWLSIDEGDNDPQRFFTYLVAALRQVLPGIAESTLFVATDPRFETVGGKFIVDGKEIPSSGESYDEEKARRLREMSQEWCNLR